MKRRNFLRNIVGAGLSFSPLQKVAKKIALKPKASSIPLQLDLVETDMYSSLIEKYGNEDYSQILHMLGRSVIKEEPVFKHIEQK